MKNEEKKLKKRTAKEIMANNSVTLITSYTFLPTNNTPALILVLSILFSGILPLVSYSSHG